MSDGCKRGQLKLFPTVIGFWRDPAKDLRRRENYLIIELFNYGEFYSKFDEKRKIFSKYFFLNSKNIQNIFECWQPWSDF